MTSPLGNSEFCFPRILMFPETKSRETLREILGDQNSLFHSRPVIKCLLSKLFRPRWLDIGLVLLLLVYGPQISVAP